MDNIERQLLEIKESLEREIGALRLQMTDGFAAVNARLDAQALRMDRHAALWQTGRRWSARMDDWADGVDKAIEAKDREIAELRERIVKLEQKPS